jgi:hypothetical protein
MSPRRMLLTRTTVRASVLWALERRTVEDRARAPWVPVAAALGVQLLEARMSMVQISSSWVLVRRVPVVAAPPVRMPVALMP